MYIVRHMVLSHSFGLKDAKVNSEKKKGEQQVVKVNNEIKAKDVRVLNEETKALTDMTLKEAIELAERTEEDVIMLSYNNGTPVVKIEEYSKYMYREQKKRKANAKKQRENNSILKEVRMLYQIEEHDLGIKANTIDRLLGEGNKVKITITYKGRAVRMIRSGIEKMKGLEGMLKAGHKVEKPVSIDGNRVTMTVSPVK